MNVKTLRSLAAVLVFASAHSATAETLGEHPAVIVARTWSTRGVDQNILIMRHPANPRFRVPFPIEKDKATREQAQGAANAVSASK